MSFWLRLGNWFRFAVLSLISDTPVAHMPTVELCVDLRQVDRNIGFTRDRMGPGPERSCNREGLNSLALPPRALIALPVKFPVMKTADRDSELVADLTSHGARLGKLHVVGI